MAEIGSLTGLPLEIASQVVFGLCDLDGSSLRALQSLKAAPGYRAQHYSLGLTGMEQGGGGEGGLQPAFTSDVSGSPCSSSIGIVNISSVDKGEGAPPEVTLISVNAVLPEQHQARLLACLVDLVSLRQRKGGEEVCLYVVASALLQKSKSKGPHILAVSGAESSSGAVQRLTSTLPPVPITSQIQDGPLALLHHMCEATGTRSAFILVPGYRPAPGSLAETDSCETAGLLVNALLGALNSGAGSAALATDAGLDTSAVLSRPWFNHHLGGGKGQENEDMYC